MKKTKTDKLLHHYQEEHHKKDMALRLAQKEIRMCKKELKKERGKVTKLEKELQRFYESN